MSKENKKYQVNIKSSRGETVGDSKSVNPNKHKNFDKVYKKYSETVYTRRWNIFQFHKPKNRKIALFIMLVLIVAALVIMEYVVD